MDPRFLHERVEFENPGLFDALRTSTRPIVVGELKTQIKDAILDGIIPNSHDEAFDYLLQIAKEKNLVPVQ